jgi:CHAT domain-containing protein/tetratricopeptide (TPR) repeat protein
LDINEKAFGSEHTRVATNLDNLGILYVRRGEYAEAEPLHKRALDIREKILGLEHPGVAYSLINLGHLYKERGKYAEAELLFKRSLTISEKMLGLEHPDVAATLGSLAELNCSLGEYSKSLANFSKSQESRRDFIDHAFSYASEDLKINYIQKYPLINNSFLTFALLDTTLDSKKSAVSVILNGKAVILDAISAEKEIAFCSYDDEIIAKAEKHAEICGEIATLALAGAERLEPEIYKERLQTLYGIKDSLETKLSGDCAEFRDELASRRFTVEDVSDALAEDAILWEFVQYNPYDFKKAGSDKDRTGPPRYLAFTLNHIGEITLIDLGEAIEIDSFVTLTRQMIYNSGSVAQAVGGFFAEQKLAEVTGELYDLIFAPLESSLVGRTQIFMSPDGQLNLLPFEILPDHEGKYAIEKYNISYLSSGRDLLKFKKKQAYGDWALAMADPDFDLSQEKLAEGGGKKSNKLESIEFVYEPSRGASSCLSGKFDPLPYTLKETISVVQTLKKNAQLDVDSYCGEEALEGVLKGMKVPPRILHLSTHGYFCEDINLTENKMLENPLLRSGLAFAGANGFFNASERDTSYVDDGILTALEVSGLNLIGTELVTLSACETGVGEVGNGEGVYGLRRAFQHAGARAIIMSLWKVPDPETGILMSNFYENWSSGETMRDALRQAALSILNERRDKYGSAHPYFWGGFILLGDPD